MVEVLPFKGIKFSSSNLKDLITEPYDKIPKSLQNSYYARDPHNFVRLNLPIEEDPYSSAKETLRKWLSNGILIEDDSSHFYQYIEEFSLYGEKRRRTGMFAIVKLEDYNEKKIYPHEKTFKGPKEDRLKMLRATNTDLEPVFFLYDDPKMEIVNVFDFVRKELDSDVTDENGVRHLIYRFNSEKIVEFFKGKSLVIADGHHRYETALAFSKEKGSIAHTGYIMAVLVNRYDPGLVILPSHRVITSSTLSPELVLEKLREEFELEEMNKEIIKDPLEENLVFYFKNHAYRMVTKGEKSHNGPLAEGLNVSILNNHVISKILNITDRETIKFIRWTSEAIDMVDGGNAKFAFLVKPVEPRTVWDIAMNGEVMPEKSTDFYPKLISGLKIFDLMN